MPSLNHIHTYGGYNGRPKYVRCYDPLCTHFIEKEVAKGKMTRCHDCGSEFILDPEAIKRVRPKCLNCASTKKAIAHQTGAAAVQEAMDRAMKQHGEKSHG